MSLRVGLARVMAVAGLVMAATFGLATAASAHDVLIQTDPANGSEVATVPAAITLTFNQPALAIGSVLRIIGPAGDVAAGAPVLVDRTVREAVRPGAPAGAYTVQWRVTSIDGHPISGEFTFTAAAGSDGSAATGGSAGATTGPSSTVAALPPDSGDSGSGSAKPLILLLIVAGALVVSVGIYLAVARPGPTLAADEIGPAHPAPSPVEPPDDGIGAGKAD